MARNGSSYRSNHDRFDGCYNFNAFKSLAEQWKADVVRIAMYVNEQGYNTKPAYWKGRVTEMVDWAG
jgi:endoglucanase